MVTSADLIQEQIRVARRREAVGHPGRRRAVAATRSSAASTRRTRTRDFAPGRRAARRLRRPRAGPWTRVDSHCYPGWTIAPFYDSLIAKLIVWAPDRDAAIERMQRALSEFQIEGRGVKTTIPFHQAVLADERFRSGDVDTSFLEHFTFDPPQAAGRNRIGGAMEPSDSYDVAILGGGLAGLTLGAPAEAPAPGHLDRRRWRSARGPRRRPPSRSASRRSRSAPTTSRACAA